jgi:hypothetical protein
LRPLREASCSNHSPKEGEQDHRLGRKNNIHLCFV